MLGTPYWDYPTWQKGTVQSQANESALPCMIAYNVISNEVLCRFNNDSTAYRLKPEAFTIGDAQFVRRALLGYSSYYQVLYDGSVKLLESVRHKMKFVKLQPYGNSYLRGYYLGLERSYYLKLPNGSLHPFALTRKSLIRTMGDSVKTKLLPVDQSLTVSDVVRFLADYDVH